MISKAKLEAGRAIDDVGQGIATVLHQQIIEMVDALSPNGVSDNDLTLIQLSVSQHLLANYMARIEKEGRKLLFTMLEDHVDYVERAIDGDRCSIMGEGTTVN